MNHRTNQTSSGPTFTSTSTLLGRIDLQHGHPRHQIICNLGRKDLLAPNAEALLRILKEKKIGKAQTLRRSGRGTGE